MNLEHLKSIYKLSDKPESSLSIGYNRFAVYLYDENKSRISIEFDDFKAMKLNPKKYFMDSDLKPSDTEIMEVLNSNWQKEIFENIEDEKESINYKNNARHFIIPLENEFLEVIAFSIEFED